MVGVVDAALVVLLAIAPELSSSADAGAAADGGKFSAGAAVLSTSSSSSGDAADRGRKLKLGTNSIAFMLSVENVPPRSLFPSWAMANGSSGL